MLSSFSAFKNFKNVKHVLFNNSVFVLSLNPIPEGVPKIKVCFFIVHKICTFVDAALGGEGKHC